MHRADRIANRLHDMWKGTTKASAIGMMSNGESVQWGRLVKVREAIEII